MDIPTPGAEELETYRQMMIMMDPTKHTKLRQLVNNGFTPRMVGQLEARVRDITADIVNRVIDRGECDFVIDVAAELPSRSSPSSWAYPRRTDTTCSAGATSLPTPTGSP